MLDGKGQDEAGTSDAEHPMEDHAADVASWLKVLKDDPKAVFLAAGKAQAAADWMQARQPSG